VVLYEHPSHPGLFLTKDGRAFRELPASPSDNGYRTIKIGRETIRRHTLMAETFVGPRPPGQGVRHIDGDPGNDHPDNLAWGTQAENMADAIRQGTFTRGDRNGMARLTEEQAREIKRRRAAGESGRSLAREFNISEQTVALINTGKQWSWL
jgi:DNA-binding transcriptional regulator YiaG